GERADARGPIRRGGVARPLVPGAAARATEPERRARVHCETADGGPRGGRRRRAAGELRTSPIGTSIDHHHDTTSQNSWQRSATRRERGRVSAAVCRELLRGLLAPLWR